MTARAYPTGGVLLLTAALATGPAAGADPEIVPPAFRAERHFAAGLSYLESLPAGSTVTIARADGSTFRLDFDGELLTTTLPDAHLEDGGRTVVTPLGFRLYRQPSRNARGTYFVVESPNGEFTRFSWWQRKLRAGESDGGVWTYNAPRAGLRLSDGTLLEADMLERRWTVSTLDGRRFREEGESGTFVELARVPSPPLIPSLYNYYQSGDGNDWRRPLGEQHVVFAWNWYPYGLPLERAIEEVRTGRRRRDLDLFFNELERPQRPVEMAAYILGRRLALIGGDRVTFQRPGEPPELVFLLPSAAEPRYAEPKSSIPQNLTPRMR